MPDNTPNTPAAQPIPIITCDASIADEWFSVVQALVKLAMRYPTLAETSEWKRAYDIAHSMFESAFSVKS